MQPKPVAVEGDEMTNGKLYSKVSPFTFDPKTGSLAKFSWRLAANLLLSPYVLSEIEKEVMAAAFGAWVACPRGKVVKSAKRTVPAAESTVLIHSAAFLRAMEVLAGGIRGIERKPNGREGDPLQRLLRDEKWRRFLRHMFYPLGGFGAVKHSLSRSQLRLLLDNQKIQAETILTTSRIAHVCRIHSTSELNWRKKKLVMLTHEHCKTARGGGIDTIADRWNQMSPSAGLLCAAKWAGDGKVWDRIFQGRLTFRFLSPRLMPWLIASARITTEVLKPFDLGTHWPSDFFGDYRQELDLARSQALPMPPADSALEELVLKELSQLPPGPATSLVPLQSQGGE